MADPVFDLSRTRVMRLTEFEADVVRSLFAELQSQGRVLLQGASVPGIWIFERTADVRFVGQGHELRVPLGAEGGGGEDGDDVRRRFLDVYRRTYGRAHEGDPIEVVTWRLRARCQQEAVPWERRAPQTGGADRARRKERPVYFPEVGGFVPTPVLDRYRLAPGDTIPGPAIVEERESTVVLLPDDRATIDDYGNLVATLGGTA
jgi:N-methylhydantoinase A